MSRANWISSARELSGLLGSDSDLRGFARILQKQIDSHRLLEQREYRARSVDLHYAVVAPLATLIVAKMDELIHGHADLLDRENNLDYSTGNLKKFVNPERRFAALWSMLPGAIAEAVQDVYETILKKRSGPFLLRVIETNLGIFRDHRPGVASLLKADLGGQLSSAVSALRKIFAVAPRVYAQHGVTLTTAELAESLSCSQLPLGMAMLDGMRLAAVDRLLCGCTAACYRKDNKASPHRNRFESVYQSDVRRFQQLHASEGWYVPEAFGIFGPRLALWPTLDFRELKDPGESHTSYGAVPVDETPVLSGRRCPATYSGAVSCLQQLIVNLINNEELLGYALQSAYQSEVPRRRTQPTELAPPLPFSPSRQIPLLRNAPTG